MANELILIVEDNEKNLKLARDVLRFHGFRTVEATDGESAITMSVEHLPALILMDIQLPGIDGIVAMKRIRAQPPAHLIAVDPGQHDVKEHQVGLLLQYLEQRLLAGQRRHDLEAVRGEHGLEQPEVLRDVVYREELRHCFASRYART